MAFFEWKTSTKDAELERLSMGDMNEELGEGLEYDNMYDGLGETLEETKDDMNEDTFGVNMEEVGKDFDFSTNTQKMANMINEEQAFYREKDKMMEKMGDIKFLSVGKENRKISDTEYISRVSNKTAQSKDPCSDMVIKGYLRGILFLTFFC